MAEHGDVIPEMMIHEVHFLKYERHLDLLSALIYLMSWRNRDWIKDSKNQELFADVWVNGVKNGDVTR